MNPLPRHPVIPMIPLSPATLLVAITTAAVLGRPATASGQNSTPPAPAPGVNLALVARPTTSFVSGHETITALNDGATPRHSDDKSRGAYGNWPRSGTQWVQYDWTQPISTRRMDVYWFDDHRGVRLPAACRLSYWNGTEFVPVADVKGLGLAAHQFNTATFPEIVTHKLRLELDSQGKSSTGILEWRVYDSGNSPNFPPTVDAGVDRLVVASGRTYLSGTVKDDGKLQPTPDLHWSKNAGPGEAAFADAAAGMTTATFSAPGDYVLQLTAHDGQSSASGSVRVRAVPPPPATPLRFVWPRPWQVSSPFWRERLKGVIVNWIPHCVRKLEDPATKEGGIENFVQAARKLAGQPATHTGPVFANTWTYNTLESMCLALLLDPQGDPEIAAAQTAMRRTIDDWIPKLLAAQEPDGYLHTLYTIRGLKRWSNKHDHEGYQAGYFIEAAIAHCLMTDGKDTRLLDAARRLADCWVRHIGPAPKQAWYEGHQELEQALVRFARFVELKEGPGKGAPYVTLARFLLDSRQLGEEYDQSHLPVTRQYEAVGHAVRAVYSYAGMADIAMETGDLDYHSAVLSLWNSIVNRKYYVTGGIGSGETSEGFGEDYSLPLNAYCESCANCGQLFLQHKLLQIWQDARHADLAEETLYNAILGGLDLEGRNFTYTNPLDASAKRYLWHGCPCCVGNLPRTLLMLPTWAYAQGEDELCVNLFVGCTVTLPTLAGTSVQLVQTTDYPRTGKVALTLNPAAARAFTLKIRVPNRQASNLYTNTPAVQGLASITLNGAPVQPALNHGYAVLRRTWTAGDTVQWEVPMPVQRVRASHRIAATRGRVALRRGPLLYNLESIDQDVDSVLSPDAPLSTAWRPDLLGGVTIIQGKFADGKPLLAIPNYARLNRGGRSLVWIRER
ncbi:MAG: glycoside hydrolase family 127 protein [Verrucomicrobia bacterium]|nr:glycoside hydrolase family 127 protein [Verrucomicrobiota bacterium]